MTKALTFIKYMVAAGLVFGLFFGIGAGVTSMITQANIDNDSDEHEEELLKEQDGKRTNILVLGVDARPGETKARSDTMMLVSIDPKLDKAAVISIPRDTKVDMPGTGFDKICAANIVGGPEYAVEVVEDLMDVNVDYYVEVDFNGFKDVIDTLGGVTINVPYRMYKPSEDIDLKPGLQRLDGRKALAFVRFRDYINGDIDRTKQQQAFIKALADEVLQPKTLTKLPKLIKQANKYVDTNMGATDMLRLASWAPGFTSDSIITQTLPGAFYDQRDENGILLQSYWVADESSLNGLINNLMKGKTVAVIQGVIEPVKNNPQDSENNDKDNDEDNDEDIRVIERDEETDWERSKLPSPGHNGEYDIPSYSGPEGYI